MIRLKDTESLFREINEVFQKYGVGQGFGFVPDRLDISIERSKDASFSLVYREFFTYLPAEVLEVSMRNAIEFLSGLGIPREKIHIIDKGVEVKLSGDAKIVYFPALELLIQDRELVHNPDLALNSLSVALKSLVKIFEFNWWWDSKAETQWNTSIKRLSEVIEANPEMQHEIEEIVKRYTGYEAGY